MSATIEDIWTTIADEAAAESPLWGQALLPAPERKLEAVFSRLGEERYALGLETIYEGYLLHYGRPRLFTPPDHDNALLLGDYLYAHGLVRVAAFHQVGAVADLAELISLCAQVRAQGSDGDGSAWAATATVLGEGRLASARDGLRLEGDSEPLRRLACEIAGEESVAVALAAHRDHVG
jgi:hypothetical protein